MCKDCNGGFITYDISNKKSFESIDYWEKILKNKVKDVPIILLGNKSDLALHNKGVIKKEEGEQKAKDMKISFYEICADRGTNIQKAFYQLINEIQEKEKNDKKREENEPIQNIKKDKCCCRCCSCCSCCCCCH